MHGIFHEARKNNFPIKQFVLIKNSSRYNNADRLPVDILIDESSHHLGWASENYINSYVEFFFLVYQLNIEGYSLSYPPGDDEMIRNWELRCYFGEQNFQIDLHTNDDTLCPNKPPLTICGYNDQKYFPLSKTYRCNSIRLTQTGPNNNGRHFLNLLGFEVFGQMAIPLIKSFHNNFKINCVNYDTFLFSLNIVFLL